MWLCFFLLKNIPSLISQHSHILYLFVGSISIILSASIHKQPPAT